MGEGLEVFGLARKTRVERGWIDLGFHQRDTFCVPNLCKNLISIHHLTKQNNVFVEFHPFYFLVKDKISGVILLKGACNNGIYTFPAFDIVE